MSGIAAYLCLYLADTVGPAASKTVSTTVINLLSPSADFDIIPTLSAYSMLNLVFRTHANGSCSSVPAINYYSVIIALNQFPCNGEEHVESNVDGTRPRRGPGEDLRPFRVLAVTRRTYARASACHRKPSENREASYYLVGTPTIRVVLVDNLMCTGSVPFRSRLLTHLPGIPMISCCL